ncbi:predicted protein [Uncinocarpus reesii 1704]|uniref:Uncharacterized protein n=1 Tax=Uncinocarpus reesii (strain UAMH 1704) TaxID=336963 RepID=C4JDR6_UNCRE|nr:uncharacterized protein UREG_00543 [Uncinocarpus reesii 1704]EEP75696.1 predicted protein [Uncinocarpus reesii 1704]
MPKSTPSRPPTGRPSYSTPTKPERAKPYEDNGADTEEDEPKANGKGDDVVMIIDSDEEDNPPAEPKEVIPTVQYEEEEDEIDPRRPFLNIIESFNIRFGVKVLKLSIPSILPDAIRSPDSVPPALSRMIIFSAACADSSVRLIAAPLAPPPPANGPYLWDFQTLTIPTQSVEVIPPLVSMTFTCEKSDNDTETQGRSRRQESTPPGVTETWKLLLAVHSMEARGKLSLYQIGVEPQPIQAPYPHKLSEQDLQPAQQIYLSARAKSISFHPSQYPSDRHAHLLLVFERGNVDLYSVLPPKPRNISLSDRRRSEAEAKSKHVHVNHFFTLHTDFDPSSPDILSRKNIVDAKWALGGRAIIVLTTDGEWGLWDIDASGPDQQSPANVSTFSASLLNSFVLKGRIRSPEVSSKSQPGDSTSTAGQNKTKFAPMTPSTRRMREEALLKGAPPRPYVSGHSYRGGISVIPASQGWDKPIDESIILWHEDKNMQIPSLLTLWKSHAKPSEVILESSSSYKPALIQNINLLGELENAICYIPSHFQSGKPAQGSRPDILITAERRLLILASKLQLPEEEKNDEETLEHNSTDDRDQTMLQRGELDLDGMDRVMAGMANNTHPNRPNLLRSSQNTFFS